jgi:hypothetical protein
MKAWINPNKAKMSKREKQAWIDLMTEHHPEVDWDESFKDLIQENVKGTGRKSKKD